MPLPTIHLSSPRVLRLLDRDPALALLHEHHREDHDQEERDEEQELPDAERDAERGLDRTDPGGLADGDRDGDEHARGGRCRDPVLSAGKRRARVPAVCVAQGLRVAADGDPAGIYALKLISDEVIVLYLGSVMERAPSARMAAGRMRSFWVSWS